MLRFLQIPKCGGTTLNTILHRQYLLKKRFLFTGNHLQDKKRYEQLPEKEKQSIVLFTGHAPITTGIEEADNAVLFTMLREPVSRVLSFCRHVAEGKSPYLRQEQSTQVRPFDLDAFLQGGNCELSNLQTKMLINTESCADPSLLDSMTPAEALDAASENLFNTIDAFGIQELFDESLLLFSRRYTWKLPFYTRRNIKGSEDRFHIENRHLEMIQELNTIDADLYARARKRFIETMRVRFPKEAPVRRFTFINENIAGPVIKMSEDFFFRLKGLKRVKRIQPGDRVGT